MKNTIFKQTESKIKAYFESLIVKETIEYRLKILNRQKSDLEEQKEYGDAGLFSEEGNALNENRIKRLKDLAAEIFTLTSNLNLIEKEYADTEYLLGTLPERERKIIYGRYRDKKTYLKIGYEIFLSESRVQQIVAEVFNSFNGKMELIEQKLN
ncbi:MAG: hypothetical protein LBS21_04355 [Clostridiales bacterium]|nr:hypothetical protein [Clostridiales bacterium]